MSQNTTDTVDEIAAHRKVAKYPTPTLLHFLNFETLVHISQGGMALFNSLGLLHCLFHGQPALQCNCISRHIRKIRYQRRLAIPKPHSINFFQMLQELT